MADDSELDYIRTFLGKVHTTATVKHWSECRRLKDIADDSRMLVHLGELINANPYLYEKLYEVELEETTEILLTTALKNIITGIYKLNNREPITEYTRPSELNSISIHHGSKAVENSQTKRWFMSLFLDIKWVS